MKHYNYFIFDLDGTLVDSSPSIYASIRNTEQALGLPPVPQSELYKFVGPPLSDSFVRFYHTTPEQMPGLLAHYRRDYKECTSGLSVVYPYVIDLLEYLRAAGCGCAVATLKNRGAADVTLAQMELIQHMDFVAALEDHKPCTKASLIQDCIDFYGNPPKDEIVFFGDSPYDGVGAQDAGVDFVALTYGFGFLEPGSLEGLPCVRTLTEPRELLEFVKSAAKQV